MTDWKCMARALGFELSDEDLTRTVAPLENLEPVLARMSDRVKPESDPAVIFDAGELRS